MLPNVPDKTKGLAFYENLFASWQAEVVKIQLLDLTVVASIALQSLPSLIGKASAPLGGNALGLTDSDGGRFITELSFLWVSDSTTPSIYSTGSAMTTAFDADLQALLSTETDVETYLPLFINDAAFDQEVMQSLNGYSGFKALQKTVDPDSFFSKRTGGFKY
jgi:hypothetical protein